MIFRVLLLCVSSFLLVSCASTISERVLPAPTKSSFSGSQDPKNYELAPNDTVSVTVFQEPDMTTAQQIARDGSISFPLIGRVVIGGKSLSAAEQTISSRLAEKYLVNPQVSIAVTTYATQTYTILGQVGAPGAFPIPYDEEAFTLPMAIARAGGNTRIGNLRNIRVNRRKDGKTLQYTINMLSVEGQQFLIERGDLITVQETLF